MEIKERWMLRYVIKNSKQLNLDERWFATTKKTRKVSEHPYWYVYDKVDKTVVENSKQQERQFAKNMADRMNNNARNH